MGNILLGKFPDGYKCNRPVSIRTEVDSKTGIDKLSTATFVRDGVEYDLTACSLPILVYRMLELNIISDV